LAKRPRQAATAAEYKKEKILKKKRENREARRA
jgi:hypothetical protein